MHRHTYQGRKLQRDAGPRRALIRGQLTSLVLYEAITTTEAKAKEVAPHFERLVTYAKQGTLASGRQLRKELLGENAALKMIREIGPALTERHGGYTRIIKLANRRGDNAPMARLSLVLEPLAGVDATEPAGASSSRRSKSPVIEATSTTQEVA